MLRPMSTIGVLLDAALDFALHVRPEPVTMDPERLGLPPGPRMFVEPRSIARALLAEHLRQDVVLDAAAPAAAYPYPTFEALAAAAGLPLPEESVDEGYEEDAPDLILLGAGRRPACVATVGYGWEPDAARDAFDQGMKLMWAHMTGGRRRADLQVLVHLFVHETGFGETIRITDRAIDDWIGTHYGPINGVKRIGLPMIPRLVRTGKRSPLDGAMLSKIDGSARPTGFAAYAIVYERDAP